MRSRSLLYAARYFCVLLAAVLLAGAAATDLGPKDGAGLSPTDIERVKVGDQAPDFTLENMDGRRMTLSSYRGKKNVVLVFYRGYW